MRIAKEWEKRYQRYHTRFGVWYRWYRFFHSIWFISMGYISHQYMILRGYHMGGSVIWFLSNEWWCDITNERGTSEWVISHQHEFDKIISHCHPCDYLFIIYHNTRNNRNFVYTHHSHIYYTSTLYTLSLFNFTNYRLWVVKRKKQCTMLSVTWCGQKIKKIY